MQVVIVGFGALDISDKRIYDYEAEAVTVIPAGNIGPYLTEGPDAAVTNRSEPISSAPRIKFGNQPIDGGHLILDGQARAELLKKEPGAEKVLREFLGAEEFLNGSKRWCLWLADASPAELRAMPEVMKRVAAVREFRLSSKRPATRELAASPTQFAFVSHENAPFLLIPSVSSERRRYIPMGFMPARSIASNLCLIVPGATIFHFGVLSSAMHMAWVKQVCGRLESRYRYSNKLVYNNFPWSETLTASQSTRVGEAARDVLDARKKFPGATFADLYDPLAMPAELSKAHSKLDRAVDLCYRPQPFESDLLRFQHLFALYERLAVPLLPASTPNKRRQARRASSGDR